MPPAPRIFDAHLHPEGIADQDLETMRYFGVEGAVAVAHHTPTEATPKGLLQHFDQLVGQHLPRMERAGMRAYAALGVHPQRVPRRGLAEVLAALPGYFKGGKVVAIGETGLHRGTEEEEESLVEHLLIARRLKVPVVVHAPQARKDTSTRRMLTLIRKSGIAAGQVMVDHANGATVRLILECGHYAGLTVHPEELSAEKAVEIVRKTGSERLLLSSDAGDGSSDIVGLARAVNLLRKGRLSEKVIERVTWRNALLFYRLS